MKTYYKMIVFVFVLGALAAGLLVGTDALTKKRIEQNKLFELQSAILDASETDYNQSNIFEKFEQLVTTEEGTYNEVTYKRYIHKETNYTSFEFFGNGLWGPIKGVLTLEEDFKTIVKVNILEQEETPGLGARIGEEEFLQTLVGKMFDPTINIIKDYTGDALNSLNGITGATGTSGKFQEILNSTYLNYLAAFTDYNPEEEGKIDLYTKLLEVYNIEVTDALTQVEEEFNIIEENDLTLYVKSDLGLVTFVISEELIYGVNRDEYIVTPILITLRADFETVEDISVLHDGNTNHWGKTQLLTEEVLKNARLKKFPNLEIVPGSATSENQIDGVAGTTGTRTSFNTAINVGYDKYVDLLKTVEFDEIPDYGDESFKVDINDVIKNILTTQGEHFTPNNYLEAFRQTNILVSDETQNLYYNKDKNVFTYYIIDNFLFDEEEQVAIIVTLNESFDTILNVRSIYDYTKEHLAKEVLFNNDELLNLTNSQFALDIYQAIPNAKYVSNEAFKLEGLINIRYNTLRKLITSNLQVIKDAHLNKMLLEVNGISTEGMNYNLINTKYNNTFIKYDKLGLLYYVNLNNNSLTYMKEVELKFGRNGTATTDLDVVILVNLKNDANTINQVDVLHDRNQGHWGKRDILLKEELAKLKNKTMTDIINNNLADLDVTGVTYTKDDLHVKLEDMYDEIKDALLESNDLLVSYKLLDANKGRNEVIDFATASDVFTTKFTSNTKEGKTLYTHSNGNVSYVYEDTLKFFREGAHTDTVKILVTLNSDFETIVSLSVLHDGNTSHWGKTRLLLQNVLDNAIGSKFPNIVINDSGSTGSNEFDGVAGVTFTKGDLQNSLNTKYDIYSDLFKGGN